MELGLAMVVLEVAMVVLELAMVELELEVMVELGLDVAIVALALVLLVDWMAQVKMRASQTHIDGKSTELFQL